MAHGLLIIEQADSPLGHAVDELLSFAQVSVGSRQAWPFLRHDQLSSSRAPLLLLNALHAAKDAERLLHWLRRHPITMPTLAILPGGDDHRDLLHAASVAVDDFLLWPVRPEEFRERLLRLTGPISGSPEDVENLLIGEAGLQQMVGRDPAFVRVLNQVALFASSDATVLITGETGTGKELCARVIHLLSKRHARPFVTVDCGAVPDHLFENELFGHSRGAFTDAQSHQRGLVSLAQGGTLFMDELDGLSVVAQAKVLRLLQENTFRPLGSEQVLSANARVIAATNVDLEAHVRNRQFRQDLFFRVNVLRIHLPPLRERPSDIPLLARSFVDEICRSSSLEKKALSPAALAKLQEHNWPGNVRELYNTVQRAVLSASGSKVGATHINLHGRQEEEIESTENFRTAKVHAIERFERCYVERMLHKHSGNITRAAHEAGKDRRAFGRLVKKYGVFRGYY